MVRTPSIFSQLLRLFPRLEFEALVAKHGAEKHAKGFSCWTQFVAMAFCQLSQADSLREICTGLSCTLGKLRHLGVSEAPKRSTLSYANAHRPAAMYEELFWQTLSRFRGAGELGPRRCAFRFKNKLLSLDSTTVSLCLSLFPWAKHKRAKGGVKAHVLLDHDDYMPAWLLLTEANVADVRAARMLALPPESIVAMDRAYNDFEMFGAWTARRVFFVTRMKDNTLFEVVEERRVPDGTNVRSDQVIRLTGAGADAKCPSLLRRVVVWDEENSREIVLLSNLLDFDAAVVGAIYKERWQIELFFKALKQNLKVKSFVGTTENALRIQIWTALIALLLVRWICHLSRAGWSLSLTAAMLRMNLFVYRDLREWLDDPLVWKDVPIPIDQLQLPIPRLGQPRIGIRG